MTSVMAILYCNLVCDDNLFSGNRCTCGNTAIIIKRSENCIRIGIICFTAVICCQIISSGSKRTDCISASYDTTDIFHTFHGCVIVQFRQIYFRISQRPGLASYDSADIRFTGYQGYSCLVRLEIISVRICGITQSKVGKSSQVITRESANHIGVYKHVSAIYCIV